MSDVEYHDAPTLVTAERLDAVLQAACTDPVSPAIVVATLVRALAVAVCALGYPDEGTIDAVIDGLRIEIQHHAQALKQTTRN